MSTVENVAEAAGLRKLLSLPKPRDPALAQAMTLDSKRRQRCSVP